MEVGAVNLPIVVTVEAMQALFVVDVEVVKWLAVAIVEAVKRLLVVAGQTLLVVDVQSHKHLLQLPL
ncbi:hypothetical protein DVH05_005632 [Phytophthora capsici]|nr:hypothetical protein DVH05_005632 [Phytophthora capsici]